jgi:hypothetical protein
MSEASSEPGAAKSETQRAAQNDLSGRRKPDWWLMGSLLLVVISIFGFAYMLWK